MQRAQRIEEFPAVFDVIERFHLEGEPYLKEAATIRALEGIQNVAGSTVVDPVNLEERAKLSDLKTNLKKLVKTNDPELQTKPGGSTALLGFRLLRTRGYSSAVLE